MKTSENNFISSKDLAISFLEKADKNNVITEVFNFFTVNCVDFCKIDTQKLDELIEEFEKAASGKVRILTSIIEVLRSAGTSINSEEKTLAQKIEQYIEEHLFENFAIEQMAKDLNISFYYMCHLFKEYKGCSISKYKNTRRLQKAEKMLTQTDMKITDIALKCGYESISYFTELFTKYAKSSPRDFRNTVKKEKVHFPFYNDYDICLANRLKTYKFLSDNPVKIDNNAVKTYCVHMPDSEYAFLHEAAIIEYNGTLFTSWYNCPENELSGKTPVRGKRSYDGGQTWSDIEIIDYDPDGNILFCPPVYGICDNKLYMFINEMVSADRIHALNLYVLDNESDKFIKLWSRPIPFKLNTNVMELPDGKLILPGRIAPKLNGFPDTPAVLISDNGKIDSDWRLVKIAEDSILPDGETLVHPEICPVITDDMIYMFCRNDRRLVPLIYTSSDNGESWSGPFTHDITIIPTKMYCGKLSDGQNYIVCNADKLNRSKLVIYFSKKNEMLFDRYIVIAETEADAVHYPVAYESNGKLYIIYTRCYYHNRESRSRGADLSIIDLNQI